MSTPTCIKKTVKIDPRMLDVNRLDATVRCRIADAVPSGLPAGSVPTGARVAISTVEGWSTQALKVRKFVGAHRVDFDSAVTIAAGTDGVTELPADELAGADELVVGADAVEAAALVLVGFELDFPAPERAAVSAAAFG